MTADDDGTKIAPQGQIWVCAACGKTSKTRSGFLPGYQVRAESSHGWDESCMLNAVLCYETKGPEGQWDAVLPGDPKNWPSSSE